MQLLKNKFFKTFLILIISIGLATQLVTAQSNYKTELISKTDFNKLKAEPLTNKYGNVEALKVVYDLKTEKLYYINSRKYKFHYNFCKEYLNTIYELSAFNSYNYKAADERKRYLLGNINYYESSDSYTLELSPVDQMIARDIEQLYNKIQETSYFKRFKFFLHTSRLEKLQKDLSIPTIKASDIYGNQSYQAVSNNKNYGKLRFIDVDSIDVLNISKHDILVIDKPILELPITAGLITTKLQTPLSHISILGKNRGIPIAAYINAKEDQRLKNFNNRYVSFEVKLDTFYIENISEKQFLRKTKTRKKAKQYLKKDYTLDSLIHVSYLDKKSVRYVGGKAANFSVLYELSKTYDFKVPESAFAIPFYFYESHIKKSGTDILIKKLIYDHTVNPDNIDLDKRLKAIRKSIKSERIDTLLIHAVESKVKSLGHHRRMRFRSSTNAEDIVGFSGAGLYDSKTGIIDDSIKTVEKAIKKVWSSLWNERAFLERDHFNIDQNSVAMGVLVHRSFPSEKANGVAITKNLYRKAYFGNVINVQLGEVSVVEPEEGTTCDQIICYSGSDSKLFNNKKIIEIISYSNLNEGKLVLSEVEIVHLTKQLEHIKRHFFNKVYKRRKSYLNFALDVEFKIDGESRDLYIKQARYFND